jgi:hypothetical protein
MGFMFLKTNRGQSSNKIYYPISKVTNGLIYEWDSIEFLVNRGEGYKFDSHRARASWGMPTYSLNPREDSFPVKIVGTLGFRDGSLIQNAKDGRIYLISSSKKRLITAPLGDYGFDYSQVIEASDAEIQFHGDGEDI